MPDLQPHIQHIGQTLSKVVVGQDDIIDQLLVALLAGGHVILEGVPGTGKTLTVKALAKLIQAEFCRIQLTPDILPSDILGTNVFDLNTRDFTLKKGPIFTQVLLADEINRTPPKTQAALLEAMEEQQVTLDGTRHRLSDFFWVIATQNSLEFEGTYPLPEAQLDRFLFKLVVDYPQLAAEKQMLLNTQAGFSAKQLNIEQLQVTTQVQEILAARKAVAKITIKETILDYLLALVRQTRQSADLSLGASPRSAVSWLQACKAHAWLKGQTYVTPDNVKAVAAPLLRHRLMLGAEAQLDGLTTDAVIQSVLEQVPVPR
ncbi:MAG: MoxR family ATPase [Cyanobacteria bacterium P01_A01_bin.105]